MNDDQRVEALVALTFEIAGKPEGDRNEADLRRLIDLGDRRATIYNRAFYVIKTQQDQVGTTEDLWQDAADALTSAGQGDGLKMQAAPGFGFVDS